MRWPLFVLAFMVAAGCRCSSPHPRPTALQASTSARTPEACRACNGEWGPHGLAQVESCMCRTKDAGKPCKGKGDCESQCVATEQPETQVVDKGPPAKGYFLGHCHEFVPFFGCGRLLRDSNDTTPVALDEPPPKICID